MSSSKKTDDEAADKAAAKELGKKAFQSGEAAHMLALLKAFVATAQYAGYTPQQLAEVCTTLSCLLYATAGAPKDEFLKAIGSIYETAGELGEAMGFVGGHPTETNSPGGAA